MVIPTRRKPAADPAPQTSRLGRAHNHTAHGSLPAIAAVSVPTDGWPDSDIVLRDESGSRSSPPRDPDPASHYSMPSVYPEASGTTPLPKTRQRPVLQTNSETSHLYLYPRKRLQSAGMLLSHQRIPDSGRMAVGDQHDLKVFNLTHRIRRLQQTRPGNIPGPLRPPESIQKAKFLAQNATDCGAAPVTMCLQLQVRYLRREAW